MIMRRHYPAPTEPNEDLEFSPKAYEAPADLWETPEQDSTSPYLGEHPTSDPEGHEVFDKHPRTVRSGESAIYWALSQHYGFSHYCLVFVHNAFATGSYYPSASAAWYGATHKHPVSSGAQVPRGVPVYWTGGSHGYGHVTVSVGGGMCRSTDWPSAGLISTVSIDHVTRSWGLNFKGWSEDLNRVRVWTPPAPSATDGVVSLSRLKPGKTNADVQEMQKRLVTKGLGGFNTVGYFGKHTREAVAKWQYRCGFRGAGADGIPGRISTQRLGFKVNP